MSRSPRSPRPRRSPQPAEPERAEPRSATPPRSPSWYARVANKRRIAPRPLHLAGAVAESLCSWPFHEVRGCRGRSARANAIRLSRELARRFAPVPGGAVPSAASCCGRRSSCCRARRCRDCCTPGRSSRSCAACFHQYAFFVSVACGVGLIVSAHDGVSRWTATIYAGAVSGVLGTSALYHRVSWRENIRRWMRRLDHSMIFVLIAATYTPVALGPLGNAPARHPGGRLGGRLRRRADQVRLDRRAEVAVLDRLYRARLEHRGGLRSSSPRRSAGSASRASRRVACSTPVARSSTRPAGRTRGRRSSASTRSSTCSWSPRSRCTTRSSRSSCSRTARRRRRRARARGTCARARSAGSPGRARSTCGGRAATGSRAARAPRRAA